VENGGDMAELSRELGRVKVFTDNFPAYTPDMAMSTVLTTIMGNANEPKGDPDAAKLAGWPAFTPAGGGSWGKWGVFCPMGHDRYVDWVLAHVMSRAKELGLMGGFVPAVRMEYDASGLAAAAFKIVEECDSQELYGALVIGVPDSDEQKMAVFSESLRHMLTSLSVRLGWLDRDKLCAPSAYVRVLVDMLG